MKHLKLFTLSVFTILISFTIQAQDKSSDGKLELTSELFDSIKLRNIGPAFMSGRIADIAINPMNENEWYVAVGSGGVWKTSNAGTTFEPIFDDKAVYSTGCITIDPSDPYNIWLGTGENVGGRHVSFGDGVYNSKDGGKTWKHMGLKSSEHISKIIVHPNNSSVIWLASQGPLWSKGGERGLYKSSDGGKTWNRTLGDDEWLGVTDIQIDPRNPDRLYAATWERHRTVAAVVDGSENSRIYLSVDGGETWEKLKNGLPKGKWGKIGLAVSTIDPNVVYAAIELNRRTGGVYRSSDQGRNWSKMSDAVAGATGPHYYQEIFACPHKFDRLYLMNNRLMRSEDGGKNFEFVNERDKHGDNHSVTFKSSDPNYILVGSDGGAYESFDLGKTWRYMENIPVTQFYKLAVDDAEPFYNIFGGTQDNSTECGPSRTDNLHGIRNADWKVVLNWDGHQPATEPGNPDIVYAERQEGNLSRIDMITGEVTDIQPQAAPGEDIERFNWDAPILVSPHSPTTIFFASQRVWMSENRGDSWTAISGDLTRNQERLDLEIMGEKQSWDSPWDVLAMSNYNTITSLAESPVQKGLIYAGTDDGLLQVTMDGGSNWNAIEVKRMGVPETAFINDVKADLFEAGTVYVALDNHKYGDYKPYLLKSEDNGVSWKNISGGIPDNHLVWRLVQDHENKNLMFAGTEFGIFFTVDGGNKWIELNGGVPTISFRDLAIQRRENDLVGATFGRGFYILDDYSALRNISEVSLQEEAILFKPRDAYWYVPRSVLSFGDKKGSQGSQLYVAPNPDFGANFSYYLKEKLESLKDQRQANEKEGSKDFPGWDAVEKETRENKPYVYLEIKDSDKNVIRRVKASNAKGFNRVNWDLRVSGMNVLTLDGKNNERALMAGPGLYYGQLFSFKDGVTSAISEEQSFNLTPLREAALQTNSHDEVVGFWRLFERLKSTADAFSLELNKQKSTLDKLFLAAQRSEINTAIYKRLNAVKQDVEAIDIAWNGYASKNEIGEKNTASVNERLFSIQRGIEHSTYGPTTTHKKLSEWIEADLIKHRTDMDLAVEKMIKLYEEIRDAGGPIIEGLE